MYNEGLKAICKYIPHIRIQLNRPHVYSVTNDVYIIRFLCKNEPEKVYFARPTQLYASSKAGPKVSSQGMTARSLTFH